MRIFISAGEASGDERAGELVREMRKLKPSLQFVGMGGDNMARAGVRLIHNIQELGSVVGFQESVGVLRGLRSLVKTVAREALASDLMLTIDYPGFHLYLASKVSHPKAIYYIPPQTWAWAGFRARLLARYFQKVLCILPFEQEYFQSRGVDALFVGHPVVDKLNRIKPVETQGKPVFAFLPGSRPQEIRRLTSIFVAVKNLLKERYGRAEFLLSLLPGLEDLWSQDTDFKVFPGMGAELLSSSDAALVASGTASLEAGYLGVPSVVVYSLSSPSYWVARAMARVPFVSLTNIILGREVFPEHIQRIDPKSIADQMTDFVEDRGRGVVEGLFELRKALGPPGAAKRAAEAILKSERMK